MTETAGAHKMVLYTRKHPQGEIYLDYMLVDMSISRKMRIINKKITHHPAWSFGDGGEVDSRRALWVDREYLKSWQRAM